jgi:hypothetical protein
VKNFPNQFNEPRKFRQALEAIQDLASSGKDPGDDADLGVEFVRRGIYNLRGRGSLRARLAAERRKPPSSQGTRTAARETRRSLIGLSFIASDLTLTRSGRDLLGSEPNSDAEKQLWRRALIRLTLDGGSPAEVSHPVLVLLRLIERWAFNHRDGMELALEARNDGEAELRRMLRLLKVPRESRREKLGISKTQQENAWKIFPTLAEHAGLAEQQSPRHPYTLTELGKKAIEAGVELRPPMGPRSSAPRSRFKPAPRRRRRGRRPPARSPRRALSAAEQAAAEQLLYERTERHEDLVDRVTDHFPAAFKPDEDRFSFDLLVDPGKGKELLLLEMKTLESDEVSQTRRAVGQLLFYEKVVVPQKWPARKVLSAAVFEAPISEDLCGFLQAVGIGSIWCDEEGLHALNRAGRRIVKVLDRG